MDIRRHVGKTKTTGQKIVVVFRQLSTGEGAIDRNHCLVVQTSQLPDMYHDNLMKVVESAEAQQTHNLYEILSARTFADGQQMLSTLHRGGYLKKTLVDEVVLHPGPHMTLPLRQANNAIDGVTTTEVTETPVPLPVTSNVEPVADDNKKSVARGKLTQAELLEAEALKYREDAYLLDPTLRPLPGRPEDSPEVKATKLVSKNAKRRENYHKKKTVASE